MADSLLSRLWFAARSVWHKHLVGMVSEVFINQMRCKIERSKKQANPGAPRELKLGIRCSAPPTKPPRPKHPAHHWGPGHCRFAHAAARWPWLTAVLFPHGHCRLHCAMEWNLSGHRPRSTIYLHEKRTIYLHNCFNYNIPYEFMRTTHTHVLNLVQFCIV